MKHNKLKLPKVCAGWRVENDGAFTNDSACAILQNSDYPKEDKLDAYIAAHPDDDECVVYCYSLMNQDGEFESGCQFIGSQTTKDCQAVLNKMIADHLDDMVENS